MDIRALTRGPGHQSGSSRSLRPAKFALPGASIVLSLERTMPLPNPAIRILGFASSAALAALAGLLLTGCSRDNSAQMIGVLEGKLAAAEARITEAEQRIKQLESDLKQMANAQSAKAQELALEQRIRQIESDGKQGGDAQSARAQGLVPLQLYWSPERRDNFVTGTERGANDALAARYRYVRDEACIFSSQKPNTVPLNLYWSASRGDNFTTASNQGAGAAKAAGYVFARTEGYVFSTEQPGTVALSLYWSAGRGDNFTTATSQGANDAKAAGYVFVRTEAHTRHPNAGSPVGLASQPGRLESSGGLSWRRLQGLSC